MISMTLNGFKCTNYASVLNIKSSYFLFYVFSLTKACSVHIKCTPSRGRAVVCSRCEMAVFWL